MEKLKNNEDIIDVNKITAFCGNTLDSEFMIKDGKAIIKGELTKELIDATIRTMVSFNIKRIIFQCYNPDIAKYSSAIKKIEDVREYRKEENGFVEYPVTDVYQIFNPEGIHFINGPFQKCKICKNWVRYSQEELDFFKEHDLKGTATCKRCKGRKVV